LPAKILDRTPPSKFDAQDNVIDTLHKRGLYYCLCNKHWHSFYLGHAPHALIVLKQKVFNAGPQGLVLDVAPEVLEHLQWDAQAGNWIAGNANDGFARLLGDYVNVAVHLPQLCQTSALAVERALELLEGPEGNADVWFKADKLQALHVDIEESIRRVTVHQETDSARPGVKLRRRRVRRAQTAVTLAGQPVPWPPAVQDLADGFRFLWQADDPHRNVEPLAGTNGPATLVYLDEDPETDRIKTLYQKLRKALSKHMLNKVCADGHGDLDLGKAAEAADRTRDRLCLVFKHNHQLVVYRPSDHACITEPAGMSPVDIYGAAE
jgi:hypothetical protein